MSRGYLPSRGALPGYMAAGKGRHATQVDADLEGSEGVEDSENTLPRPARERGTGKKKKLSRRERAERELKRAAARRRQDALDKFIHSPPNAEDIWICEFCEYERIFGEPPWALIRQYEIKDQKIRRQEEERKRLLEKAKAKSRKGKKPAKPTKAAQAAQASNMEHGATGHSNTTDEEYINPQDDSFDGSYTLEDPPMLLSDDPGPDEDDTYTPTPSRTGGGRAAIGLATPVT